MEFRVESFEQITSTNDRIKQAIDAGEPEGLAVRALVQTAGYGRQGRTWQSPLGGMYQSFLLRPEVGPAQLPTLSLLVGIAARRAVVDLVPQLASRAQVKWPNDLVVTPVGNPAATPAVPSSAPAPAPTPAVPSSAPAPAAIPAVPGSAPPAPTLAPAAPADPAASSQPFLKLGGISLEAHRGAICVGVGVNVSRPADEPQANGKNIPVFLDELGLAGDSVEGRIESVADMVCAQIAALYPCWCESGLAPFVDEFNACSALAGREVRMEDIEGNLLTAGVVQRVCPDGRLSLRASDGSEVLVGSGEAHIRAYESPV